MSTATATPVVIGRYEKPGNLAAIAGLAASGQTAIRPNELIRTTDNRVYHWTGTAMEIVSAPVHHGTVAAAADLAGVYLLPSCTRGVHTGDTAYVTAAGCEYRVISGVNATAAWSRCTAAVAVPTAPGDIGAVSVSATGLGVVGAGPLDTTTGTAAEWAALPVGYSSLMSADIGTVGGLPVADLVYTHKLGARDVSGGSSYLATGYLAPELYVGVSPTIDDLPAWRKTVTVPTTATVGAVGQSLLTLGTPEVSRAIEVHADGSVALVPPSSGGVGGSTWYASSTRPLIGAFGWQYNGDANGVVYALGSLFGTGPFTNPVTASPPRARSLRSSSSGGSANDLTDRVANQSHSSDVANSWYVLDLIDVSLEVTDYTFQASTSYNVDYPRTWRLQGANTLSSWSSAGVVAATWTDIDVRSADTTLSSLGSWGHWTCNQPTTGPWRYIRILLNGVNSSGRWFLTVSEIELYGTPSSAYALGLPAGARGWACNASLAEDATAWIPYYAPAALADGTQL